MKKALGLFAFFVLASLALAAQAAPSRETVSLTAEAAVDIAPDQAVIAFNVSVQETQRSEAYAHASRIAEQIRAALAKHGVDAKTAEIGGFALEPVYDYSAKRRLKGFRVSFDVTLKLKDFAKAAELAEEFGSLDNASEASLSYGLADAEAARQKAIVKAIEKARAEAAIAAEAGGRKLGRMVSLSVGEIATPIFRSLGVMKMAMTERAAAPTENFTPTQQKVSAHVTAEFLFE